jgi:hypothetical protein
MTRVLSLLAASAIAVSVSAPAFAGWDRGQVFDPAFSRSYDRQIEVAADRLGPPATTAATSSTAIATNDPAPGVKVYFGARSDFAAGFKDTPYDN